MSYMHMKKAASIVQTEEAVKEAQVAEALWCRHRKYTGRQR